MKEVIIIDLGIGNLYSLKSALEYLNYKPILTEDIKIISEASQIILPGDGAFKFAVDVMRKKKIYDVLKSFDYKNKKILGICLGHQAIGEVFGGQLKNLDKVYHGISTPVNIVKNDALFKDLPKKFKVGRYHSWVVKTPLPSELIATSFDDNGQLMSLRHKIYDVCSVQYHPESVLTPNGKKIIENWINS